MDDCRDCHTGWGGVGQRDGGEEGAFGKCDNLNLFNLSSKVPNKIPLFDVDLIFPAQNP